MPREEKTISTSATSAVELAKNKRKIIYKNIQVNHPIKLSFNDFRPRNTFSRSQYALFMFKCEYRALHKNSCWPISTLSKEAVEKWKELSDDTRRVYLNFSQDVIEYHSYKPTLTYQLIKF